MRNRGIRGGGPVRSIRPAPDMEAGPEGQQGNSAYEDNKVLRLSLNAERRYGGVASSVVMVRPIATI